MPTHMHATVRRIAGARGSKKDTVVDSGSRVEVGTVQVADSSKGANLSVRFGARELEASDPEFRERARAAQEALRREMKDAADAKMDADSATPSIIKKICEVGRGELGSCGARAHPPATSPLPAPAEPRHQVP